MVVAVMVIVGVVCAGFSAVIADRKGRSVGGFAIAGLLLGVVGLIWAACARPAGELSREEERWQSERDAAQAEADRDARRERLSRQGGLPQMRWPDDTPR